VRAEFSRVLRTDCRRLRDMSRDRDSTVLDARTARSVTRDMLCDCDSTVPNVRTVRFVILPLPSRESFVCKACLGRQ